MLQVHFPSQSVFQTALKSDQSVLQTALKSDRSNAIRGGLFLISVVAFTAQVSFCRLQFVMGQVYDVGSLYPAEPTPGLELSWYQEPANSADRTVCMARLEVNVSTAV